jgi:FKBP-type peptidyl-prolyl cis-trans isomerase SlyD
MVPLALMFVLNTYAWGEDKMIEQGKTVKLDYTLYVDGQSVDSSQGGQPLEYVHGNKMIIPGLESQLEGLKEGDAKTVTVAPTEAYGEIDPNAVMEVPRTMLAPDITPEVGMVLQVPSKEGRTFNASIEEIKEDALVLNFNHPLAGKELKFDVKVVEVK